VKNNLIYKSKIDRELILSGRLRIILGEISLRELKKAAEEEIDGTIEGTLRRWGVVRMMNAMWR
jgi:hypothetical protein